MFTDASNGDYRLTSSSPAVDSGENTDVIGVKDIVDNLRIFNTTVDMGAYEFGSRTNLGTIYVDLNEQLYSWTIENLVKNAIDAMKGKGDLHIAIKEEKNNVKILVKDNGMGIPKRNFNKIFEPGYTSKKRGWGLGLSLAKRIIVDYHDGRIHVKHSEIGKGTTFEIILDKC